MTFHERDRDNSQQFVNERQRVWNGYFDTAQAILNNGFSSNAHSFSIFQGKVELGTGMYLTHGSAAFIQADNAVFFARPCLKLYPSFDAIHYQAGGDETVFLGVEAVYGENDTVVIHAKRVLTFIHEMTDIYEELVEVEGTLNANGSIAVQPKKK